jgi:hypothetical protein
MGFSTIGFSEREAMNQRPAARFILSRSECPNGRSRKFSSATTFPMRKITWSSRRDRYFLGRQVHRIGIILHNVDHFRERNPQAWTWERSGSVLAAVAGGTCFGEAGS